MQFFLQPPPFLKGWSSIPLSGSMQPGRPLTIHRYTSGTSGTSGTGTKRGAFYWQHEVGTVKDGHWDGKIGGTNSIFGHVDIWISPSVGSGQPTHSSFLLPLVKLKQGNLIQLKLTCWQGQQERTPDFRETPHFNWKFKVWLGGFNAPDEDILPAHRICLLSSKQVVTLS